jgi:hypothetical protein
LVPPVRFSPDLRRNPSEAEEPPGQVLSAFPEQVFGAATVS